MSKRQKAIQEKIEQNKTYSLSEAIQLIKSCATARFNESVDVSINLGIDSRKSGQVIHGATVLPHGTGRIVRVAVFAQGDNIKKAKEAGADVIGLDDLARQIQSGDINFDVVIATPETMRVVSKVGQVLGPRGLMPNPKVGTVTSDVIAAIKNAKRGQVRYRADRNGIIHCMIGKVSFEEKALKENLLALFEDVKKLKPNVVRGTYLKKLTLSSTMGPGIIVDRSTIE